MTKVNVDTFLEHLERETNLDIAKLSPHALLQGYDAWLIEERDGEIKTLKADNQTLIADYLETIRHREATIERLKGGLAVERQKYDDLQGEMVGMRTPVAPVDEMSDATRQSRQQEITLARANDLMASDLQSAQQQIEKANRAGKEFLAELKIRDNEIARLKEELATRRKFCASCNRGSLSV